MRHAAVHGSGRLVTSLSMSAGQPSAHRESAELANNVGTSDRRLDGGRQRSGSVGAVGLWYSSRVGHAVRDGSGCPGGSGGERPDEAGRGRTRRGGGRDRLRRVSSRLCRQQPRPAEVQWPHRDGPPRHERARYRRRTAIKTSAPGSQPRLSFTPPSASFSISLSLISHSSFSLSLLSFSSSPPLSLSRLPHPARNHYLLIANTGNRNS